MPKIIDSPPAPGSAEWSRMITASKVPGILGVSRWTSQFAAWHELAGNVDHPPMNADRAAWGHIAEESLAKWWLHNNPGWHLNVWPAAAALKSPIPTMNCHSPIWQLSTGVP